MLRSALSGSGWIDSDVQQTKSHQREFDGFPDRHDLCEPFLHLTGIVESFRLVDRNAVDFIPPEDDSAVSVMRDDHFQHLLYFDGGDIFLLRSVGCPAPVVEHDRFPAGPWLAADRGEFPTFQDGLRELGIEWSFYHDRSRLVFRKMLNKSQIATTGSAYI